MRRSELIYNFLKPLSDTTKQDEDIFHSKLVDISLKRMIKTVPAKFLQERGQHLDSFLQSFINSTEPQKAKPAVPNMKDIFNYAEKSLDCTSGEESPVIEFDFKEESSQQQQSSKRLFKVNSIYDYIIIILTRICNLKGYNFILSKLLRILQPVLHNTIEYVFHLSVQVKINNLLSKENVNKSILYLKATLEEMENQELQSSTNMEKMRKQKSLDTLNTLQSYFSNFMPNYLSFLNPNNQTGYFLHSVFQYQLLNKQFFYLFFNLIFEDVFPELIEKKSY